MCCAVAVWAGQRIPPSEHPSAPTVDFTVLQADGTPVTDLQPADVEIRINERVRAIRSLRRVTAARPRAAPTALPPPYGTNDSIGSGRRFALVIDQESLATGHEPLLRNAVEGLIAELAPGDQVSIAALPFEGVRLQPTSDTARIRRVVEAIRAQGSRNETGSELACRTRRFLESLDSYVQRHGASAGPWTLVIFTAGLAAPRRDAPMTLAPGMCELPIGHFQQVAASAAVARANVYVLQPADIGLTGGTWRDSIAGANYLGSDNPLEGIEHLAGVTRGVRLPLDGTGTAALRRVMAETSAYYEAELEPVAGEVLGRSRTFDVRVKRPGLVVRARPQVALIGAPPRPAIVRLAVPDLLASTEPATSLPLRVGGFTVREPDGQLRVGVLVEPVDPAAALVSAGAILIDTSGRAVGRWFAKDAAERPLLGAIAVAPGTYRLRAAAVDASGRPGVAEDVVDAQVVPAGPLLLGSLILGVSRAEGARPQLQFSSEPVVLASFDIYGGTAGLRLLAKLEVARDASSAPLLSLPLTLTRVSADRVAATGAVALGALPAGDYLVRGIIRLEDGTSAQVVRTLRKVK